MSDAANDLEIERKFILGSVPSGLAGPGRQIWQGYLSGRAAPTEVRIRSMGNRHFLTVKSGSGLVRHEREMRISRRMFETMWPFTQTARIAKTRYREFHSGRWIEVDVFQRALEPLVIAEVELEAGGDPAGIDLPDWIGTEVTGHPGFSNSRLAFDGLPRDLESHMPGPGDASVRPLTHAGSAPYRISSGGIEVLCVTSRSGKRWIVPKGVWDAGQELREVAINEAWEEAGVTGSLSEEALGIYNDDRVGRQSRVLLYLMKVESEQTDWPERSFRDRQWLSPEAAAERVALDGLSELIGALGTLAG